MYSNCSCRIVGCVILCLVILAQICCTLAAEVQAEDDLNEGDRIPLPDTSK